MKITLLGNDDVGLTLAACLAEVSYWVCCLKEGCAIDDLRAERIGHVGTMQA
jgi:UDP-glucose 6-dehydrogenase